MSLYSIALFIHIVGTIGFFIAMVLEWMMLRHLRQAVTPEQIDNILRSGKSARRLGMISMALILAGAFYMTMVVDSWTDAAWPSVAVGAMVVMAIFSMLGGRRLMHIEQALRAEAPTDMVTLRPLALHPLPWVAIKTRLGIALGVVFIMSVKPDLTGSLIAIASGAILGFAAAHVNTPKTVTIEPVAQL
jgi:hypothetical protein